MSFSTVLTRNYQITALRLQNQYPLTQKYQKPPKMFDPKISFAWGRTLRIASTFLIDPHSPKAPSHTLILK